jgi:hypothetical protein
MVQNLAIFLSLRGLERHERATARAQLLGEELRLFARREVPALFELVVVDEFGIRALCPTLRRWTDLVGKDAHGNRDGDGLDAQIRKLILPVKTRPGKRRVRQPRERDVVEDVVSCETGRFSGKGARDQFVPQLREHSSRVSVDTCSRQFSPVDARRSLQSKLARLSSPRATSRGCRPRSCRAPCAQRC